MTRDLKLQVIAPAMLAASVLIAILVLVSLSKVPSVDRSSRIPAPPEIVAIQLVVQDARPSPLLDKVATSLLSPNKLVPVDKKNTVMFGLENDVLPKIWVLQVGDVNDIGGADDMLSTLHKAGYKGFIDRGEVSKNNGYRLYVGPKIDLRILRQEKLAIEKKFSVKTEILRYVR